MKLVNLAPEKKAALAETIIYAFGRRVKALRRVAKHDWYLEPFPMSKLYERYPPWGRRIINLGLNVWFEKVKRGNSGGPCSLWRVRSEARLDEGILEFLRELYKQNLDHMQLLKSSINAKDKKVIVVTTQFAFTSEEQAQMFCELADKLIAWSSA